MAPLDRRMRRGRGRTRWGRVQYMRQPGALDETIAGDRSRCVFDSYCPYCATNIRAVGPRRLVRCPNTTLCGKVLPVDENSCPNCTHYTRPSDNFCRICRTNLRSVVRGRGGLYQQINRVPSPLRNGSPPRPEPQPDDIDDSDSDDDDEGNDGNNGGGAGANRNQPNPIIAGGGQGGFLRVVAIDD